MGIFGKLSGNNVYMPRGGKRRGGESRRGRN